MNVERRSIWLNLNQGKTAAKMMLIKTQNSNKLSSGIKIKTN